MSRCRLRTCSVKLRGNSTGHASRCRLPPVSKRPQSVRVCRMGVSRRQAKGELHRARAQVSPSQRSESVKLRGNSRVSRGVSPRRRSESVQLRGNSTGHAPRCRSVRKAFACVARVCRAVKLRGNSTGHAPRCRLRSVLHPSS